MKELVVTLGVALPQNRPGTPVPYLVPIGPKLWQTNLSDSEPGSLPEVDLADEGFLFRDMQSDSQGYFSNSLWQCLKNVCA